MIHGCMEVNSTYVLCDALLHKLACLSGLSACPDRHMQPVAMAKPEHDGNTEVANTSARRQTTALQA